MSLSPIISAPNRNSKVRLSSTQSALIEEIYNYYSLGKKSCLLFLPMGGGKTVIAAYMIANAVRNGKRVLFCCHRTKLIVQTQEKLVNFFGIEPGIIWGDNPVDSSKNVLIAMFQTLQNRDLPPDIEFCVFDEAHTTSYWNVTWRIMEHYSGGIFALSKCLFLGLSGSPWRSRRNKEGFCQFYDCMARGPHFGEMVSKGELTGPRHFGWNGLIDYSQLDVSADGDYSQSSLDKVCDQNLNARIIEEYIKRFAHTKPIIFCASVVQAQDLANRMNDAGISCGLIVGDTPESEREQLYADYALGNLSALSGVSVFTEGFDEPSCDAVILARPTRSLALLFQMCGRGSRLHPGKNYAYLLDFCENFQRLGYVTSNHPIRLCPFDSKLTLERAVLKSCPLCQAYASNFASICPECGYVYSVDEVGFKSVRNKRTPMHFGELLSKEQRKMVAYVRRSLRGIVSKGIDPSGVIQTTFEKFRMLPPRDWLRGAIFGGENVVGNMHAFWYFLRRVRPKAPNWWYCYWMSMEFGENIDYTALTPNWADYLGVSQSADWEDILLGYRRAVKDKSDSEVIIANVALSAAALSSRKWDFVNQVTVNRATVNENNFRALHLASEVLSLLSFGDIEGLRAAINRDLHLWQRYTIKLLSNQEFSDITKLLKNSTKVDNIGVGKDIQSFLGKWVLTKAGYLYLVTAVNLTAELLTVYQVESKFSIDIAIDVIKCVFSLSSQKALNEVEFVSNQQWQAFVDSLAGSSKLIYSSLVFPHLEQSSIDLYVNKKVFDKVKDDFLKGDMLQRLVEFYKGDGCLHIRLIASH
ncbi:MAG: DEAD/DEAH box helicase [Nostochopsis sp.]